MSKIFRRERGRKRKENLKIWLSVILLPLAHMILDYLLLFVVVAFGGGALVSFIASLVTVVVIIALTILIWAFI